MTPSEKFQQLLRELFQFDSSDLDFGIYRIMNFKRDAIEGFIQKDLVEAVSRELSAGALASQGQAVSELRDLAAQISETLGSKALNGDGRLNEAFHETPLGRRYLELQARSAGAKARESLEAVVFNHLYSFFSRYYDDGDFLSKRRYSRREKYAIPYNGEEVHLHWANADQYYIKTTEQFTDYRFKTNKGISVHFKLQTANVERDNVKGDKRFFLPSSAEASFDTDAGEVLVPFEYRPLDEGETVKYGKRNQQEAVVAAALEGIPKQLGKYPQAQTALLDTHHRSADGEAVSFLDHHLRRYARRNTSDYFIHKDLNGFLNRELDFYLKNEVLGLDELEAGGEARAEGWFQLLRVIRAVGTRIIEFLAQMEEFQKKLFEKKKFVTETHYCITMGNINEAFYREIASNESQWAEWQELLAIDAAPKGELAFGKNLEERRVAFFKAHPTLVLDTKHFEAGFVDRLLGSFGNLDETTDGLLVQAENFQALNLLLPTYGEFVDCIYIDPPYNTDAGPILYKNDYRSSSWVSMMADRLRAAKRILRNTGVLCVTIDDYQQKELHYLLEREFGKALVAATVTIRNNPSGRPVPSGFAQAHEYAIFALASSQAVMSKLPRTAEQAARYRHRDQDGQYMWELFRKRGSGSQRRDRPSLFYPVYVNAGAVRVPEMRRLEETKEWEIIEEPRPGELVAYPIDESGVERRWRGSPDDIRADPSRYKAVQKGDAITVYYKFRPASDGVLPLTVWTDAKYSATEHGTGMLKHYFTEYNVFSYPKSVYAVEDCLRVAGASAEDATVCDFFAGSGTTGHAVVNLNREDGGNRKFIMVEMGQYFDTVTLPRIKKVIYSPEWKDGRPTRPATNEEAVRSPRIVRYHRLESYEDSLNNIAFSAGGGNLFPLFDDYLVKYMLDWETKDSATLLNLGQLVDPFEYSLTVTDGQETKRKVVDLPETFNFLLGLHVTRRQVLVDDNRRYLVVSGKLDHRSIIVIWRTTKDWKKEDYERDRGFVEANGLTEDADEIFVNGDSLIPGARSLDPVFKSRMFGGE